MRFKTTSRSPAGGRSGLLGIAVLAFCLNACASAGPVLPETGSPAELARAYYDLVLADRAPPVNVLARRLAGSGAVVEPVGWTVSGTVFATVISGTVTRETVTMARSPRATLGEGARAIEVCTLLAADIPDWFSHVGESRPGFASLVADRVWLDRRVTAESAVLAATLWHEYQHVRDRRHYRRMTPAVLEARGAVRELSTGLGVRGFLDRLEAARQGGDAAGHYREAATRTLEAMALALGAADATPAGIASFGDAVVAAAADALVALAEM